jgi:MinD-like ATPase involved in chromosome partitioning or flagellar assembly
VTLSVITAIADPRWEADLVAGLSRTEGVTVVRRCVDVADLLATASAGIASGVIASADLRRLDRDVVTRLDLMGVAVVGMRNADDADAEQTLRRLGIAHLVCADAPLDEVIERLKTAIDGMGATPPAPAGPPAPTEPIQDASAGDVGRMIAVWGPTGAPGRTTVAIGVAAELAAAGSGVVLVDADVYGGTIAPALGILDDGAGFASACRLANTGRLDAVALAGLARGIGVGLRVLTGLARADRWDEVRPSAAAAVLALARTIAPYVVIDCGFCLEEDEELSYDTVAPRRNGATVTALRTADTVVAVGSGDPIGLQRLVRGLAELRMAVPDVEPVVVVNRLRPRVAGPGEPRRQITDALQRFADVAPHGFVPLDQPAVDKAVMQARTLVEAAPTSPARQALAELAAQLSGVGGRNELARPASRRPWRRRG